MKLYFPYSVINYQLKEEYAEFKKRFSNVYFAIYEEDGVYDIVVDITAYELIIHSQFIKSFIHSLNPYSTNTPIIENKP